MHEVVQIIGRSREQGDAGGVPKFAWYLQRAVGGRVIPIGTDALTKNHGDLFVADGYYTQFFQSDCISVVHGTWQEFAIRNDNPPFTIGEIEKQHKQWNRRNVHCVAVSPAVARELKKHHNVVAEETICNCVDTDEYKPSEDRADNETPIVLHVANHSNKGSHLIHEVSQILDGKFKFEYLDASIGEEPEKFIRGDMFIHPSFYEGCSFAVLEAMACNLPCIVSNCGLMEDTRELGIEEYVVPIDYTCRNPKIWAEAIEHAWLNKEQYGHPRDWVLENATFELFKERWTNFLNKYR